MPKSRVAFWTEKFARNVARDRRNQEALRNLGWQVLIIWECETRNEENVRQILAARIHRDDSDLTLKNRRLSLSNENG